MTWFIVGAVVAALVAAVFVVRQRAQVWSALYAELRALGLRPVGKPQGQWHKQDDNGLVSSVRAATGEFGVQASGADARERLPMVRRRRSAWRDTPSGGTEVLSLDPSLDKLLRLQGGPSAVLTLPPPARLALIQLAMNPNVSQANASATLWRWGGAWPPRGPDVAAFGEALRNCTVWASSAQDPAPDAIRLLRTAQSQEAPWLRQACMLALEQLEPGLAATASWQTSERTVTEALDALAALPDEDVPRVWRRAVSSQLLNALGVSRLTRCLTWAVGHGSVSTSRYLIKRELKGQGPVLDQRAQALVCAALHHKSGTVQLLAAETLAERGSSAAIAPLKEALEAGKFRTPDNEMWARTAVTRIRGRAAQAG